MASVKFVYYCHTEDQLEVFDIYIGLATPDLIHTDGYDYYFIGEL